MLVLSRKKDEEIMIGDNIIISVVDLRGDKVRLGVSAPSDIPVHRREVYDAIQRENLRCQQQKQSSTSQLSSQPCTDGKTPLTK